VAYALEGGLARKWRSHRRLGAQHLQMCRFPASKTGANEDKKVGVRMQTRLWQWLFLGTKDAPNHVVRTAFILAAWRGGFPLDVCHAAINIGYRDLIRADVASDGSSGLALKVLASAGACRQNAHKCGAGSDPEF